MGDSIAGARALWALTFGVLRLNWVFAFLAVLLITAASVAADFTRDLAQFFSLLANVAQLVFGFAITWVALEKLGLMTDDGRKGRIWRYIGLGILTQLAILAGLLLIVPGILLAVRWFVADPILIGENTGVGEAIRRSWEETRDRFWPILIVVLSIYAPTVLIVIIYTARSVNGHLASAEAVIFELLMTIGSVVGWHASVATYAQRHNSPRLVEVFA